MPQQVGVGVKFAVELLAMGLRMVLHLRGGFILISIDIINAYNEIKRAAVVEAHMRHTYFRKWVPYWTAKLWPTSKLWAGEDFMEHHEGLVQGSPISSSGFSFTIHGRVKEADMQLAQARGCARFGMDDGYMIRPREVVFRVLAEFAARIKDNCGCELNVHKCQMYNKEEGVCEAPYADSPDIALWRSGSVKGGSTDDGVGRRVSANKSESEAKRPNGEHAVGLVVSGKKREEGCAGIAGHFVNYDG